MQRQAEELGVCIKYRSYVPQNELTEVCASFGWDRVNFLHRSWYGALFWVCAENSVDDTGMF